MAVARGDIIVRVDGHSYVAPAYLRRIVEVMAETGEAFVGGPVLMHADTPFRRALACALCSHIGVGSVPYRTLRRRSYVASIQTGAFRREVWERVGPFDVDLAVVEDLDFNTRAGRAGYRLLLDPSIRFWYVPRANLRGVWQQIVGVGRIKPRVLFKHPGIFKLKYAMPSLLVVVLAVCALAMLAAALGGAPRAGLAGALASGVYAAVIVGFTLGRLPRLGRAAWWLPAIVPALHVGYGVGFLRGLAALPRRRARLSAPPADHIAPAIGP
jgi:succinoglycan biosynthesis protein ExoA